MADPIKNRYDFVVLFDVENGNPNGDPDAGNMPRVDPETGIGLVTDVCLKRKIRNYVMAAKENQPGYRIYVQEGAYLSDNDHEALQYLDAEKLNDADKKKKNKTVRDFMCKNFFDIRTFGAVMTTFTQGSKGDLNCGQVRGPVQLSFAHSIEPINPQSMAISRITAVDETSPSGVTGSKWIVPYGLYQVEGYISANLARKVTGFSEADLQLLWDAIINMFENDHSAARGNMAVRKLIVFKHDSELGNAPSYKLFERVHVTRKDSNKVPRSYRDYSVEVDTKDLPDGVTCIEKL